MLDLSLFSSKIQSRGALLFGLPAERSKIPAPESAFGAIACRVRRTGAHGEATMTMARIGKFTLDQAAWVVARGSTTCIDDYGEKTRASSGGDILIGQTRDVKPGDLGVPDGSIINLYVVVVAGIDNEAQQSFIFDKSSTTAANYKLTGTTGSNTLALVLVG
jgi:hypothetical protein